MKTRNIVVYPAMPNMAGTRDNKLILLCPYRIQGVLIPARFVSDGLSLQARVLRLFVNRFSPKFAPFYFLHDYLCDKEQYKLADELGQEVLFEIETSFRTRAMIAGIRLYHYSRYKK